MASGCRMLFFRRLTCKLRSVNAICGSKSITDVRGISSSCYHLRSSKSSPKDDASDLDFFGIEEPQNGSTVQTNDEVISVEDRRYVHSLAASGYAKHEPKRDNNYETGFGRIRFDKKSPKPLSDFLPNLKGTPSSEINSKKNSRSKRKPKKTPNLPFSNESYVRNQDHSVEGDLSHKSEMSFIDDQYFPDVSSSNNEKVNARNRSTRDHSDLSIVDDKNIFKSSREKVNEANSSHKQSDLAFIDEQYFDYDRELSAGKISSSVDHSQNELNNDLAIENLSTDSDKGKTFVDEARHDASFFYDQYFDENSMYSYEKPTITPPDAKTKKINHRDGVGTTFIDEQYFENLNSNIEKSKGRSSKERLTNSTVDKKGLDNKKQNMSRDKEIIVDSNAEARNLDTNDSSFTADSENYRKERKQRKGTYKERNESETESLGAYELAMKIRKENQKKSGSNLRGAFDPKEYDSDGFRILRNQVPHLEQVPSNDVVRVLKESIIYDNNDIVAISKPYGLASHEGPGIVHCVANLVDRIIPKTNLYPIHRLDKECTGVMLLAKTEEMASRLSACFIKRNVLKRYLVITKDIPEMHAGEIDIPIINGKVGDRDRKCLMPQYSPELKPVLKSRKERADAITRYRVLDTGEKCALLECMPLTGKKHQIRVHLSFGLNCPILGDHKYAHLNKIAPMRLHPEILQRLKIQQAKVRYVPMHLHARSIVIPEFFNGKNLYISAPLPPHFLRNMQDLKMKLPRRL